MKYVNATIQLCASVKLDERGIVTSCSHPFDTLKVDRMENGELKAIDFHIITRLNLMETKKEDPPEANLLREINRGKNYEVLIRITKCDANPENRLSIDLGKLQLTKESLSGHIVTSACCDFVNMVYVTSVKNLDLTLGTGTYVIKVVIRQEKLGVPEEDNLPIVQSMYPLYIHEE